MAFSTFRSISDQRIVKLVTVASLCNINHASFHLLAEVSFSLEQPGRSVYFNHAVYSERLIESSKIFFLATFQALTMRPLEVVSWSNLSVIAGLQAGISQI